MDTGTKCEMFDSLSHHPYEIDRILPSDARFIPFETLVDKKSFPRCPDDNALSVNLDNINRDNSLLVFISHNWLRGDSSCEGWDGAPHPDNASGDKYFTCVEGINRLRKFHAPNMSHCYIWMDYCCMNQDSKDLSDELEHYDKIVAGCDCLFTPIVVGDGSEDSFIDAAIDYKSKAWCRVEMLYAANIPLYDSHEKGLRRHTLFEAGLASPLSEGRRPHFMFSKYLQISSPPLMEPPLHSSWLQIFHPLHGRLTRESDRVYIQQLVIQLQPYIDANHLMER